MLSLLVRLVSRLRKNLGIREISRFFKQRSIFEAEIFAKIAKTKISKI